MKIISQVAAAVEESEEVRHETQAVEARPSLDQDARRVEGGTVNDVGCMGHIPRKCQVDACHHKESSSRLGCRHLVSLFYRLLGSAFRSARARM